MTPYKGTVGKEMESEETGKKILVVATKEKLGCGASQ